MANRWPVRLLSVGFAAWNVMRQPRRARPTDVRRILVLHHFLLGDTIMLAPLLKKLRGRYPHAEIVLTCRAAFAELYAARPYGVQVAVFDPRNVATFWALRRTRGFDLAFVPMDNRLSWLARAVDARWIVAFEGDRPAHKNWLVDELRPLPDAAMAFGDLVAAGLVDGPPPEPHRASDWPAPPTADFRLPVAPYCVLHLGAGTRLRRWEPEKWRGVIAHLEARGIEPVLSAGPGEGRLTKEVDPEGRLTAYPGTLSLPQLWRLLAHAALVVCPDTGISHLARLAGAPLVVLFGPGSATMFGGGDFWRDVPERKITIEHFPCRDTNVVFRRRFPAIEHCIRTPPKCNVPRCMHALTVAMVVEAVDALLQRSTAHARTG